MRLTMTKKAFLWNAFNQQALIYLLADEMVRAGIHVEHGSGDAEYEICGEGFIRTPYEVQ